MFCSWRIFQTEHINIMSVASSLSTVTLLTAACKSTAVQRERFRVNSDYLNAQQYYVVRTLPIF